jgi:hypothetical protein
MDFYSALKIVGATITAGMGALGLIKPQVAAKLVGVSPSGKLGLAEIRATYGGFFLALGLYAIWSRSGLVFVALGLAWAGAMAGRIVSIVLDGSFSLKNVAAVAFEAAVAWLLLTPRF